MQTHKLTIQDTNVMKTFHLPQRALSSEYTEWFRSRTYRQIESTTKAPPFFEEHSILILIAIVIEYKFV